MRDILKFDSVDVSWICMAEGMDLLTVIPQDEILPYCIPFLRHYKKPGHKEKQFS